MSQSTTGNFIMIFIGILFVFLIPLLIIANFRPVPSDIQVIYCIIMVSLSLFLAIRAIRWRKK
jgi:hypothetical protein